jgi:hypothetical protein
MGKGLVPVVQNVPVVPVVEDVPGVIILSELWRKTSGIVPDFAHALFVVGESGTTYEISLRENCGVRLSILVNLYVSGSGIFSTIK